MDPSAQLLGKPFRPRLLSWTMMTALCVVALAEGLLHLETVRNALPLPKPYYSHNVEPRKRLLTAVVEAHGGLDILCVGSSIVRTNFRPEVLDDVLRRGGVQCVSFNGGLSGLSPASVALYLDHFYLANSMPKVVLHGVRLQEVLDANTQDYALLKGSPLESSWLATGMIGRVRRWMWDHVALLYYHGMIGGAVQRFRIPLTGDRILFQVDERGHSEPAVDLQKAKAAGWLKSIPAYEADIDPVRMDAGLSVLREAHSRCRDAGAAYVIVNVPEHGDKYLSASGGKRVYEAYLSALKGLALELSVPFVDVTEGDPSRYRADALFSDYHHMAAPGSTRFTSELAEHLARLAPDCGLAQNDRHKGG